MASLMHRRTAWLLSFAAAGCATRDIPRQQLTDSEAAIQAAAAVGAEEHPRAALHLKLAREQVGVAQNLIDERENDRAWLVLERAESDARLALALVKHDEAKREANAALREVERLRASIPTKSDASSTMGHHGQDTGHHESRERGPR